MLTPQSEVPPHIQPAVTTKRLVWLLAAALLLALALAKFVYEDALRLEYPVNDLITPWISSQVFLHGKSPYSDTQEYGRIFAAARIPPTARYEDYLDVLSIYPRVYPPTTMLMLVPLGYLDWRTALYVYLIGSSALFIWSLWVLARKIKLPLNDPQRLYFLAFALAMAPLHSSIHESNLNTAAIACLCAGVGLMSTRPYLSGVAIAAGMCLKPQIAVFFFLYPWLRKKWKTALTALAVCAALFACSIVWMGIHHVTWFGDFLAELSQVTSPTGVNDFLDPDLTAFQMVNLKILIFQFTQSLDWSGILTWAIFTLLAGVSVFLILSRVSEHNESSGIAIVSVLTLLPVYQRFYTAEILLFVLYWSFENWRSKGAKSAHWLLLPLLFPLARMATKNDAVARFTENHNLNSNLIWRGFIMPHVIWIELIILLILLASLYWQSPTPADSVAVHA